MIDDPITFEVIKNGLISVAREMSQALRLSAFSPNIKERRDCSCAVFDAHGNLVAQSEDIPVHLGAMPMSVKACIDHLGEDLKNGSMALHNDPFSGGSHLPDLTLVAPAFVNDKKIAYVANRAHHADVGGISPGSMPGLSTSIHDEGVLISPRIIVINDKLDRDSISDLLSATRTPDERLGDLSAQIAANVSGIRRFGEITSVHSLDKLQTTMDSLQNYSESLMTQKLREYEGAESSFADHMDSDGAGNWDIPILASVKFENGRAKVYFSGTSLQVRGNINCPLASTLSSVYFVFIALFGQGIPTNQGCWRCLDIDVPKGSLLNPEFPAAVSAGNVETSQRVVDVILGALSGIAQDLVPAASQGTMNNLTIGGIDHRTGKPFSFYETIGGGVGARKGRDGVNGIHSNMTNTLNTPIESLETEYPMRVLEYSLRTNSGGHGKWRGGEGIVREIQLLSDDCTVSIQSERRHSSPWGLRGGEHGERGKNSLILGETEFILQAKTTVNTLRNSIIRIETPGGGGYGDPHT